MSPSWRTPECLDVWSLARWSCQVWLESGSRCGSVCGAKVQIKSCFRGDLCPPFPSRPPSPADPTYRLLSRVSPPLASRPNIAPHTQQLSPTPTYPMSLSSQMDLVFVVLIRLSLPWGPKGQSPAALAGKAGHIIPVIKSLVI